MIWLAAVVSQSLAAATLSSSNTTHAAIVRVEKDVPAFADWQPCELSFSNDTVVLLAPLKLVALHPKDGGELKILVAVTDDKKTYRFTNDSDLAAVIDVTGLKSLSAHDADVFAQQLATLRGFPDDAEVIESIEDLSSNDEAVQELQGKIAPLKITTGNDIRILTFCFFIPRGRPVYQMTVTVSDKAPTQVQTRFLGYAHYVQ